MIGKLMFVPAGNFDDDPDVRPEMHIFTAFRAPWFEISDALPEAKHYKHVFCRVCGSSMPRIDPSRDIAVIPMGALDDDPGMWPQAHLFVDSMAAWDSIDSLPRHGEYPPP